MVVARLVLEPNGSTLGGAVVTVPVTASEVVSSASIIVVSGSGVSEDFIGSDNSVEREFHVVCGNDTDRPARSGGGDDAVVRLCGSSAVQFVKLTDGVRPLKNLDLGLNGSLSEVTTPKDHLCCFDVIGDVEVSDGTTASFGGSSLHGGLGGSVEDLLCGGPGFLHSVGVRDLGSELEREFVASGG